MTRLERRAGNTYCPACGELCGHRVLSVLPGGYPDRVECTRCGHAWTWPSAAEFARRREERAAARRKGGPRAARVVVGRTARTCLLCGSEFPARDGRQAYCSHACREAASRSMGSIVATINATRALQARMDAMR